MLRTVVVYEVGDADAEQRRLETGVETANTLALDDTLGGIERRRLRPLRLDLGASGEGDERVAGLYQRYDGGGTAVKGAYVRAMESSPPPAPAKA